jgi:hypothetical protein
MQMQVRCGKAKFIGLPGDEVPNPCVPLHQGERDRTLVVIMMNVYNWL